MAQTPLNVCLVVIFNHRYEKNIDKLQKIYRERFPAIYYLMPFYRGDNTDVIPVYEQPSYYQGYIMQALSRISVVEYDAFIFLADDLVLNPILTAENIHQQIGLDIRSAYIKNLRPLADAYFLWLYLTKTFSAFHNSFSYECELPSREEANKVFAHHGLTMKEMSWRSLLGWHDQHKSFRTTFREHLPHLIQTRFWCELNYLFGAKQIPYPLLFGYSDFIIVPSGALPEFARLCGVFAAMNLWVECAIPTALALSCERIVTEQQGEKNWFGKELWNGIEVSEAESNNKYDLTSLLESFEPRQLYLHPVKLSKWNVEGCE